MAMPRYRLEALLRIKQHEKHRAEARLAKAIVALQEARKKEEALVREKQAIVEQWLVTRGEMRAKMDQGGLIFDGAVYVNYLRKLKEDEEAKEREIETQRDAVLHCEAQVAACRRDYIDAARELQIMEKHKDLWRKKVAHEMSRKEEREFDELANTIAQLRRWHGEKEETAHTLGW
ncbi:MAG: hypothetical protein HY543_09345 [Deltaproteobacteria bacterium]|nr:hypothetical protein [Deltaproteobacteria bacterium]